MQSALDKVHCELLCDFVRVVTYHTSNRAVQCPIGMNRRRWFKDQSDPFAAQVQLRPVCYASSSHLLQKFPIAAQHWTAFFTPAKPCCVTGCQDLKCLAQPRASAASTCSNSPLCQERIWNRSAHRHELKHLVPLPLLDCNVQTVWSQPCMALRRACIGTITVNIYHL